nr:FG-GAP repeat [uncultured bacterium]
MFARNQGGTDNWGEVKKILASDKEERDRFGHSVSINDDTAIVGANSEDAGGDNAGAAYIFERNQGGADNWGEVKKLLASDKEPFDVFGESVSISGDTVIVGALFEDGGASEAGAAYIFARNQGGANNWGEVKKLLASDSEANDEFGWSVAINGDAVIVGAHLEDEGGSEAGAAYIFTRNQGGADNWGEVKKLLASDIEVGDLFGNSVAISGDTVIVGSPFHDESETNAGAAYIFTVSGSNEPNEPPAISPQSISVARGNTITGATIATVSDDQTPASSLAVFVISAPSGITVTNITNTKGTITANVAASCAAALGANTVVLSVTDTQEATTMANLIVTVIAETTPPVITCPANLTVVAPSPSSTCVVVNYTTPTATDNCGASVVCVPPSGSCLPLGTTTVACTATDTSGNTATCSFTVTTFNLCLQDDSNPGTSMLISTATGAYRFCCGGTTFTGVGTVTSKGSTYTLTHNASDRRVQVQVNTATNKATASLQAPAGTNRCTITDRDTRNNTCSCTGGA